MKLYNLLLIVFISNLLPRMIYAGTDHYVNCSCGSNGDGTGSECGSGAGYAWNNIPSVNSHNFSTGDDVYFKSNTTCTITQDGDQLKIDWAGTSGDRVIIGAYYGNGQFGLNGNGRPIIDGDGTGVDDDEIGSYPSTAYKGLVEVVGTSYDYVTIQDLKVQYAGYYGILVSGADNINIDNCYIYRSAKYSGIIFCTTGGDGVDTGIISDNIVEGVGYPTYPKGGAAIEITSGHQASQTKNITVTRNRVFSSKQEGIGLYKKTEYCTVEYNTVYDIRTYHIYISKSRNNIVRYNLSYNVDDAYKTFPTSGGGAGVVVDDEMYFAYQHTSDNEVYGNLIAGQKWGIILGCQIRNEEGFEDTNCFDNTIIYNNTLVDNENNYYTLETSSSDTLEIKNNISYLLTDSPSKHVSGGDSPAGVTWSHNLYYPNSIDTVGGNAATDAVIGDPSLNKISGWRNLTPGSLSPNECKLSGTSSTAYNAGTDLGGSPYNLDYWGTNRDSNQPWDIGAHEYTDGDTIPPAKPTGLMVVE